jgi:hypothetical protein
VGTSKILARYKGSTINLQAALHLGHMPRAPMTKKKKKKKKKKEKKKKKKKKKKNYYLTCLTPSKYLLMGFYIWKSNNGLH